MFIVPSTSARKKFSSLLKQKAKQICNLLTMNWADFQAKFSTSIESFWFRESERVWWPGNGYDFIKPKLRSKLASAPNHAAASSKQCRKVSSWFRCSRLGLHSRAASTKDCGRIVVLTTRKGVTKPDWNDRPNWEVSAPSGIGLGLKFKFCLYYSWWARYSRQQ